ncbi:MAG: NERD domain-containing protein, partial [Actinobacteria bacterium]|nr:NERD domain-containing protein [Actinomycetota bacterium]
STQSHNSRKIRELRRRFVRRHWWVLALAAGLIVAMAAGLGWFETFFHKWVDPGHVMAFFLGAGVAGAVAVVVALLGMDGARSYRDGREAEAWTGKILNRLRRTGWQVIHDVEINGGNIDHVLIGPSGAVAIETKYRTAEWTLTGSSISETTSGRSLPWTDQLLGQTKRQALDLRSLLMAGGIRTDVLPALVLWGPHIEGVSAAEIDGVLVGLGSKSGEWIGRLQSVPLDKEQRRLATRAVELRKAGREVTRPVSRQRDAAVNTTVGDHRNTNSPPNPVEPLERVPVGRR